VRDAIELAGGTPVLRDVEAVLGLVQASRGVSLDLHGRAVFADGDVLRIGPRGPVEPGPSYVYRLDVPGTVEIAETGGVIRASLIESDAIPDLSDGWDAMAALQQSAVVAPLTVRTRRPGDRMRPLGAPGSRLLQDLFVDRRTARSLRDRLPVIVGGDQRILWVAGVASDERARVRMPRAGMVILEFKKGTL
jgi:tRNA(Ile)-lysidine synthase